MSLGFFSLPSFFLPPFNCFVDYLLFSYLTPAKNWVMLFTKWGESSNHIKIATPNRVVKTRMRANFPRFFFTNIKPNIVKKNKVATNTIIAGVKDVALLQSSTICCSVKSLITNASTISFLPLVLFVLPTKDIRVKICFSFYLVTAKYNPPIISNNIPM